MKVVKRNGAPAAKQSSNTIAKSAASNLPILCTAAAMIEIKRREKRETYSSAIPFFLQENSHSVCVSHHYRGRQCRRPVHASRIAAPTDSSSCFSQRRRAPPPRRARQTPKRDLSKKGRACSSSCETHGVRAVKERVQQERGDRQMSNK